MTDAASGSIEIPHGVAVGCGDFCPDVSVRFDAGECVGVERACGACEDFLRALAPLPDRGLSARIGGEAATVDDALTRAGELSRAANAPVVCGLRDLTLESLERAVELARKLGAVLIPDPPIGDALTRAGIDVPDSSVSQGEVAADADCIVLWGRDCEVVRRLAARPLRRGGERRFLTIGSGAGSSDPSETIALPPDVHLGDLQVARAFALAIRPAANRRSGDASPSVSSAGAALEQAVAGSRYTHFVLDPAVKAFRAVRDTLQRVAAEVRERHRITVSTRPERGNLRGLVEVLTWTTGSVGALDFSVLDGSGASPNEPENLGPWRADDVIAERRADLVIALGSTDVFARCRRCPSMRAIAIGPAPDPSADVALRSPGLDPRLTASVVRSDGVFLELSGASPDGVRDPVATFLERWNDRLSTGSDA